MAFYKGGRGHKAPYETVVIRLPKPLEQKVNLMIDDFRNDRETNDITSKKLSRDILESLAKKHSKKSELAKNWQAFIDEVISIIE